MGDMVQCSYCGTHHYANDPCPDDVPPFYMDHPSCNCPVRVTMRRGQYTASVPSGVLVRGYSSATTRRELEPHVYRMVSKVMGDTDG